MSQEEVKVEHQSQNERFEGEKIETFHSICEDKPYGHPKGLQLALLTISLMFAVFIMALDNTVLSTAVPSITTRFQSIEHIGWYTSAYLLPLMSLQPTFGKMLSFFPVKPIFVIAMITFEIGSILCASAPSSNIFIMGRAVSGVGAAGIYAGGMIIITSAVPLKRVSIYLATLSSMWALAALIGPPIGGAFADSRRLTWRFCFWINLPFGAIATLFFLMVFSEPKRPPSNCSWKEKITRIDIPGTILFVTSIVLLFVALEFGGNRYPWSEFRILLCFIFSALCLAAFVTLQWYRGAEAMIPPHVILNRSVPCSVLVAACMSMGCNTHIFYLPFFFQTAKGTSAISSGLRLLPYTVSVNSGELLVGTASSFLGIFLPFMYIGTCLFTIAAGLFCTLTIDSSTSRLVWNQILAGLGVGFSMQLCATSVRAAVDKKDIPTAAILSIFAPFFGSSLGATIGQNIFRESLRKELLKSLTVSETEAVIAAGGTGMQYVTTFQTVGPVKEAYNHALKSVFLLATVAGGIAFFGTICIKWRTLREKTADSHDLPEDGAVPMVDLAKTKVCNGPDMLGSVSTSTNPTAAGNLDSS